MDHKQCPLCKSYSTSKCSKIYYEILQESINKTTTKQALEFWEPPKWRNPIYFSGGLKMGLSIGFWVWILTKSFGVTLVVSIILFLLVSFSEYIRRLLSKRSLNIRKEYSEDLKKWEARYFCRDCAHWYVPIGDIYEISTIMGAQYEIK
jgi:hypothetical protein